MGRFVHCTVRDVDICACFEVSYTIVILVQKYTKLIINHCVRVTVSHVCLFFPAGCDN
jgi:hypothetical protein